MSSMVKNKKSIILNNISHIFLKGQAASKYIIDLFLIVLCYYLAFLIHYEFVLSSEKFLIFLNTLPIFFIGFFLCEIFFGLSRGMWRYISIRDLERIMAFILSGNGLTIFIGMVTAYQNMRYIPRSVYFLNSILLLIAIGGVRLLSRVLFEHTKIRKSGERMVNVLILGDGDMAASLESDIAKNYPFYRIAGFITNYVSKVDSTINGVPILGTIYHVQDIVQRNNVKYIFIATERATVKEMRETIRICEESGAICKIIPTVTDVVESNFSLKDAREVKFEDYLHREPLNLNLGAVKDDFLDKVVLVTGAGGAIGSQICRELAAFNIKKIILLDFYEGNMFNIYNELRDHHGDKFNRFSFMTGDVCDTNFVKNIFATESINYVIHAAAHKHVFLSELNVIDTAKTNILGTRTMAEIASEYSVNKFVFISTDKAVDPTSVMGATKRVGELLMQAFNKGSKTKFIAVRFGNVIGSHGNIFEIFQHEIMTGGAITITHPDTERFFMSIDEAIKLVLQAAALGEGGEIFVLDMGDPMKIKDLARDMCIFYGKRFDENRIKYIGLRPGEKLTEQLFSADENRTRTKVSKIFKVSSSKDVDSDEILKESDNIYFAIKENDSDKILSIIKQLIPRYQPREKFNINT